ncbi:hypothetical protein [Pseudoalteromonas piscicida]|uniref:Peptidase C39-like domain-containing protein n=1 Tax=Pseudoalteromonas piscicida TaxID=43662 RepID=A0A2A5JV18_PSEO7|nr:hypothetical protein [Pseudoalteromonas piscicida]PCK33285.1 hypothetical protein CEX98_01960 [Pseudoalteromonas piscicida]
MNTITEQRYFDQGIFTHFIQPQYKNFCGICSLIAVVNTLFDESFTQDAFHQQFNAGFYTKRKVSSSANPAKEDLALVDPKGMSNFDIIRLFNSVCASKAITPYSALITGDMLATIPAADIANWLAAEGNFIIYHCVGHYKTLAGYTASKTGHYWIAADSKSHGDIAPIHSIQHQAAIELATTSEKYGFILLSTTPIAFLARYTDNSAVFPIESKSAMTTRQ